MIAYTMAASRSGIFDDGARPRMKASRVGQQHIVRRQQSVGSALSLIDTVRYINWPRRLILIYRLCGRIPWNCLAPVTGEVSVETKRASHPIKDERLCAFRYPSRYFLSSLRFLAQRALASRESFFLAARLIVGLVPLTYTPATLLVGVSARR